jgi:hypothetical protein
LAPLFTFEKYPNSYRIDHPDFGDVYKTTYVKGVITDFEVTSFYRFRVKSMVKVSGDWGESGYIPLFYHPKPQFWDDPNGNLATDYNAGGGYFEKAWMSFRVGDEVVVMLKEGKPVAVVGFADGVPRIGENLIKIVTLPPTSPGWFYDAIIIFQCDPPNVYFIGGGSSSSSFYYSCQPISETENGPDGSDLKLVEPFMLLREVLATYPPYMFQGFLYERFVVVGPILYIFSFWNNTRGYDLNIRAALYTPDLFNSLKDYPMISKDNLINVYAGSGYTGTPYPGTYLQNEFKFIVWQVISHNLPGNSPPASNTWCLWAGGDDRRGYDMTVRPHTLAELQAAGMWPAGTP